MSKASIILTREQSLERSLRWAEAEVARLTDVALRVMEQRDMVVRVVAVAIRENRIAKTPIPRHRALVVYSPPSAG